VGLLADMKIKKIYAQAKRVFFNLADGKYEWAARY